MDAMEFVRERLATEGLNLREVADGAGVGHSWLRMFARGEIPDPGYSRIKALADYFLRVGSRTPTSSEHSPPQQAA
jgi:transcriptional regulator with XRE-family HTH domain